jgi:hypothetical protein
MRYWLSDALLRETFEIVRRCGRGRRECQALWLSEWDRPEQICAVVHPRHSSHAGGFQVVSSWINDLWNELARTKRGIRVQIHTHPAEAFHSAIDDAYPIIHEVGFLSLVIPDFGLGPIGFESAYLAEIASDGSWKQVPIESRLVIV